MWRQSAGRLRAQPIAISRTRTPEVCWAPSLGGTRGTPAWTPPHRRDGLRLLWTAVGGTAAGPPWVAPCMADVVDPNTIDELLFAAEMTLANQAQNQH